MKRHYESILFTIIAIMCVWFSAGAESRLNQKGSTKSPSGNAAHRAMMYKDPIINKYLETRGGTTMAGWKDVSFRKTVKVCGAGWFCSASWGMIQGTKSPQLTQYYRDGLETYVFDGTHRWKMSFINEDHYKDAAYGALFHHVPKLADLIAPTISTSEKLYSLWGSAAGKAYWTLYYVGAKNKLPEMVAGLDEVRLTDKHVRAIYLFSPFWSLKKKTVAALENVCFNKVFQPGKYENVVSYCLRWLGQIGSKHAMGRRYLKKFINSSRGYEQIEAIRALGRLGDKSAKNLLQNQLAKAYYQNQINVKKGRRYVRKKVDTWRTNFNAVPAAVALYGMGDRTAAKAIKYWMEFDKKKVRCNHTAIEALFMELPFASKSTQKKLSRDLAAMFKTLKKYQGRKNQLKNVVRRAALALLQTGNTAGMKEIMDILGSGDQANIKELLSGLGGEPTKWVGHSRNWGGLGFVPVGKGGISIKDAGKIANKIKSEFLMWNDKGQRALALRAWIDFTSRIAHAKNKL